MSIEFPAQPQLADVDGESHKMVQEVVDKLTRREFDIRWKLPISVIQSPEVQQAAKEAVVSLLSIGFINSALKLKDVFVLPEAIAQQAAKERMVSLLSGGNIDTALKLRTAFALPESVIQSPEVQQAAKKGMVFCLAHEFFGDDEFVEVAEEDDWQQVVEEDMVNEFATGHINTALKFKDVFAIPETVVQLVAKEGMINSLSKGYSDHALKLKDAFSVPEDTVQQAVKEGVISLLSTGRINNALNLKDRFLVSKDTIQQIARENGRFLLTQRDFFAGSAEPSDINQAYTQEREHIVAGNDAEVGANFETLEGVLGADRAKRLLLSTSAFWGNPHDYLLFMGVFRSRSAGEQALLARLVVQPLLVPGVDLTSFGMTLSSFDINVYVDDHGEIPFRTVAEFERQVQMQKLSIRIPEGASEAFEEAVQTLVLAPGVDVPFIRTMLDIYEGKKPTEVPNTDDYEDDEGNSWNETPDTGFATQLIDIIEGRDAIDERQRIRSWETEVSFDPLHKVLLATAGIRGFNEQSPKLYGLLRSNENLTFVIDALRTRDKAKLDELKVRRDELKMKYPDKAGRYDAEFRANAEKETILKLASGDEVTAIRIENRDAYANRIAPEEWNELFTRITHAMRDDPAVVASIEKVFATLTEDGRREMVVSFVDVEAGFFLEALEHIQGVYNNIIRERTEGGTPLDKDGRDAVVKETVRLVFSDETVGRQVLVEFLLYLALNNRTRLDTGKKVLGTISSIFGSKEGKRRYEEQARVTGENNLAQAYLKGKITLEPQDEQLLRDAYSATVKTSGTRSLSIEIARKSDPRGWVCGDYTDCCMPFTSSKNQEYLLREDMSYFLVSRNDAAGSSDLVGQSVLVYGEDDKQITVAIDNIEIANRAVNRGERAVIAKAYDELKKHLIDTYGDRDKRLKIVIGTSYNDDGGLVTGACELKPVNARPLGGDMKYSDWYHHSSNYILYDSEAKESVQKYYGLSLDAWEASRTRGYITRQFPDLERREHERRIEDLLRKIGRGEDDGDGGLSFADNYSVALVRADKQVGYVIAADYLSDDSADDLVHFEEMHLDAALPESEKRDIFEQYLKDKKFKKNDDLDGLKVSKQFIADNPFVRKVLKEVLGGTENWDGDEILIRFDSKK